MTRYDPNKTKSLHSDSNKNTTHNMSNTKTTLKYFQEFKMKKENLCPKTLLKEFFAALSKKNSF